MESIKIVNIGAGSSYTPDFAEKLIAMMNSIPIREWVLMDVDESRLNIVGEFTADLIKKAKVPIEITMTNSLEEAVMDSDFVFTTMRVGKAKGRTLDVIIPEKHGLLGQETTAPGGLAMGLRNIPVIVDIAKNIEEYAKPDAWLINLANPGGMLTEAVYQETKCKAVGLCNWPSLIWDGIAQAYGYNRSRIFLKWFGLNHLNWADIFVDGQYKPGEAYEKLVSIYTKEFGLSRENLFTDTDLLKFVQNPFMVDYNHFYYKLPEILETESPFKKNWLSMLEKSRELIPNDIYKEMVLAENRAEMVELLDKLAIELYKSKDYQGYKLVLGTRGGAGYGSAGLEVAKALWSNSNSVQVVDYPNLGTYPYLPYRDVVQTTCLINGAGVFPLAMGNDLSVHAKSFIQSAKHYEHLAVEAAMTGSYHKALEALVTTPLVTSFAKSKAVLDDLLVAHKDYLPNFADAIERIENGIDPY